MLDPDTDADEIKELRERLAELENGDDDTTATAQCAHCDELFEVEDPDIYLENDDGIECPHCHGINTHDHIPFFGYCSDCEQVVGFKTVPTNFTDAVSFGVKGAVKLVGKPLAKFALGLFPMGPMEVQEEVSRVSDTLNIKDMAPFVAECPLCGEYFAVCPKCGWAAKVPQTIGDENTVMTCAQCGKKFKKPHLLGLPLY